MIVPLLLIAFVCLDVEAGWDQHYAHASCGSGSLCPSPNGLFPKVGDCCSFVNCAHCRPHIQQCGPGTVFNPKLKVCDYPHNVKHCYNPNCGYIKHYVQYPKKQVIHHKVVHHQKIILPTVYKKKWTKVVEYPGWSQKVKPPVWKEDDINLTQPDEPIEEKKEILGGNNPGWTRKISPPVWKEDEINLTQPDEEKDERLGWGAEQKG